MMSARWCRRSRSARTRSASGRSLAITASALLISSSVFTPRDRTLIRSTWAAAWTCFSASTWRGLAAFQSRAMYEALGTTSLSNSSRLASISRRDRGQPGDVPTGMAERRDDARPHGIADRGHDERDRGCRLLDCEGGGCPGGHDHRDLQGEQLPDEDREAIIFPSAHRYSITTSWPSCLPEVAPPLAGRPTACLEGHRRFTRNPIRYTLPVCWAWAASDPSRMPRVMVKTIPLTVTSASSRLSRSSPSSFFNLKM